MERKVANKKGKSKNEMETGKKTRNGMRASVDRIMTTSTARETKGGKQKWGDEKNSIKKKDGRTDGRTDGWARE